MKREPQSLEDQIDRALKALPDLSAPPELIGNVLAALRRRAELPWYRRAWFEWPAPIRLATVLGLALIFGVLCFGSSLLSQAPAVTSATQQVSHWGSILEALHGALHTVSAALLVAVKGLGTPIMLAGLLAVALACASCAGLTTLYLRLALSRR